MSDRKKEMTVGDLRKVLATLDENMPIVGEYFEERDEQFDGGDIEGIGGLASASVEMRCADTPSLFLTIRADVGGERGEGDE